MARILMLVTTVLMAAVAMAAGTSAPAAPLDRQAAPTLPDATLKPVSFDTLTGWRDDDHAAAFEAFHTGCAKVSATTDEARATLRAVCRRALEMPAKVDRRGARQFFTAHFRPFRIEPRSGEGLITGYYEPVVAGSRTRSARFATPLLAVPDDLRARLNGRDRPETPYFDRAAIEDGAIDASRWALVWLADPVDAFFAQIQGSARVRLGDGTLLRFGFAARNGHAYTPIGRFLIERGVVPREEMSLQRIRAYLEAHPVEGRQLMRANRSFVFFRPLALSPGEEALGALGTPLVPRRSIAVDASLHPLGTPLWIEAELPLSGEGTRDSFRHLVVAQDTGSAIVGAARADLYFGAGNAAAAIAGRLRHPARFVVLLPQRSPASPSGTRR